MYGKIKFIFITIYENENDVLNNKRFICVLDKSKNDKDSIYIYEQPTFSRSININQND